MILLVHSPELKHSCEEEPLGNTSHLEEAQAPINPGTVGRGPLGGSIGGEYSDASNTCLTIELPITCRRNLIMKAFCLTGQSKSLFVNLSLEYDLKN